MMKHGVERKLAGVVVAGLLLAGCGDKQESAPKAAAPEKTVPVQAKAAAAADKTDAVMPEAGDPSVYILDSSAVLASVKAGAEIKDRKGWKHVKEDVLDYAFSGSAVLQNNRLAVVVNKGAKGAEVYALTARGPEFRVLLAPKGGTEIADFKVVENGTSSSRIDMTFKASGGKIVSGVRLTPGDNCVESCTGTGMRALIVNASITYAIVPNFFADDLVFHAGVASGDRILLPTEQFFLSPVEGGNSIMMCVCESETADVSMLFAAGKDKVATGAEIQAEPGKKIWIAFMESTGNSFVRKAGDKTTTWKAPFVARWRLNVLKDGAYTESFAFKPELLAEKDANLLIYPLERDSTTPLNDFCMRDIMKATLGIGPCEYVIKADGLANAATPHEAAMWTLKQFDKGKEKSAAAEMKKLLAEMVEHVKSAQSRIDSYGVLADKVEAVIKDNEPKLAAQAADLKALRITLDVIRASVNLKDRKVDRVQKAGQLSESLLALIGKENAIEDCRRLGEELSGLGADQDKDISVSRLSTRWLRQQTRMLADKSPEAKAMADLILAEISKLMSAAPAPASAAK